MGGRLGEPEEREMKVSKVKRGSEELDGRQEEEEEWFHAFQLHILSERHSPNCPFL